MSQPASGIYLIIAPGDQDPLPGIRDQLGLARCLRCETKLPIRALLTGEDGQATAQLLARQLGIDVTGIEVPHFRHPDPASLGAVLADFFADAGRIYVIFAHGTAMSLAAAGLAMHIGGACIPAVKHLDAQSGDLQFVRSIIGGKKEIRIRPKTRQVILTVAPGAFARESGGDAPGQGHRPGNVSVEARDRPAGRCVYKGRSRAGETDQGLEQARVVVAAGRGLQGPENLEWMYHLARCFAKGAVAGSRPVCDQGWLPYKLQVGVTGKTVTPELYLACGISGAPQHMDGMRGAEFVVAVNQDPQAAIFNEADICIVADLLVFIPALLELLT